MTYYQLPLNLSTRSQWLFSAVLSACQHLSFSELPQLSEPLTRFELEVATDEMKDHKIIREDWIHQGSAKFHAA